MTKIEFADYICRPYCMFFREGEKEEMACRGAQIIETLVAQGKIDPQCISSFQKSARAWEAHDEFLFEKVCEPCEFRAEDCEYRSEEPPHDAEPCGGVVLLSLLMENRLVDVPAGNV